MCDTSNINWFSFSLRLNQIFLALHMLRNFRFCPGHFQGDGFSGAHSATGHGSAALWLNFGGSQSHRKKKKKDKNRKKKKDAVHSLWLEEVFLPPPPPADPLVKKRGFSWFMCCLHLCSSEFGVALNFDLETGTDHSSSFDFLP